MCIAEGKGKRKIAKSDDHIPAWRLGECTENGQVGVLKEDSVKNGGKYFSNAFCVSFCPQADFLPRLRSNTFLIYDTSESKGLCVTRGKWVRHPFRQKEKMGLFNPESEGENKPVLLCECWISEVMPYVFSRRSEQAPRLQGGRLLRSRPLPKDRCCHRLAVACLWDPWYRWDL